MSEESWKSHRLVHSRWLLCYLFCVACLGCEPSSHSGQSFPRKPIKVIVPFAAGGGSDTFTRIVQRAVERHDLLPQPLVVMNVPGAGGTIGARRVRHARPDGYTLLQLHDGLLTSKYSGNAEFGPEAFLPVAGTGRMAHIIAVKETSAFEDLPSLLDAAIENPDSIVFAVGIGAPSHYAGLMLEKASAGARFRFTQSGGGAKRFASLLGGHTDVTTFSVAEFVDFRISGVRALAILSESRHAIIPDVRTAREQGVDVVSTNMHFWWAPRDTPADRVQKIAGMLADVLETEEVQIQLRQLATDPVMLRGDALVRDLAEREKAIAAISNRHIPALPNFPMIILAAATLTGMVACRRFRFDSFLAPRVGADLEMPPLRVRKLRETVAIIASLLTYVGSMELELLSFRPATLLFVLGTGSVLATKRPRSIVLVTCLSLAMSFGLHGLFTHLFIIDLP